MVAARTLTKNFFPLTRALPRARVGPKTRVGVINSVAASRGGARARRSGETRWEISARRSEVAVGSRRYLQPEPLLSPVAADPRVSELINDDMPPELREAVMRMGGPSFVVGQAKMGFSAPAYSYARNNPIGSVDRNGLYPVPFNNPPPFQNNPPPGWGGPRPEPQPGGGGSGQGQCPGAQAPLPTCVIEALIEIQLCLGQGGSHFECGLRGTAWFWKCMARN